MMTDSKYRWGPLLDAEGGEGGGLGAEVFEGTGPSEGGEPEGQQTQPKEGKTESATQPQAPPPAAVVDADQLAQKFGQVIGQHFQPPKPPMSKEEAKRILNVWEPTPEWLAKYDNAESRQEALAELRDGFVRHADTIAQLRLREMQQAIESRYAPILQQMQVQEARAGEQRFIESFPELGNPSLRPLLYSVAQSVLASGARFQNEKEMFETLAKGVESVIKVNNPEFSLGAARAAAGDGNGKPVGQSQRPPVAGALPVTTPGSGSIGNAPKGGPQKPRGLAIFDP